MNFNVKNDKKWFSSSFLNIVKKYFLSIPFLTILIMWFGYLSVCIYLKISGLDLRILTVNGFVPFVMFIYFLFNIMLQNVQVAIVVIFNINNCNLNSIMVKHLYHLRKVFKVYCFGNTFAAKQLTLYYTYFVELIGFHLEFNESLWRAIRFTIDLRTG